MGSESLDVLGYIVICLQATFAFALTILITWVLITVFDLLLGNRSNDTLRD